MVGDYFVTLRSTGIPQSRSGLVPDHGGEANILVQGVVSCWGKVLPSAWGKLSIRDGQQSLHDRKGRRQRPSRASWCWVGIEGANVNSLTLTQIQNYRPVRVPELVCTHIFPGSVCYAGSERKARLSLSILDRRHCSCSSRVH